MTGKIVVVTGAARGIGRAIAEALLKDSLNVIGIDVNQEKLAATNRQLRGAGGEFSTHCSGSWP